MPLNSQNLCKMWEKLRNAKIAFRYLFISLPLDLICLHAGILVIYSDTSLCLAALSVFKYILGIDKDRSHSRHPPPLPPSPPPNSDYQEEQHNRLGWDIFTLRRSKTVEMFQEVLGISLFMTSRVCLGFISRPHRRAHLVLRPQLFGFEARCLDQM